MYKGFTRLYEFMNKLNKELSDKHDQNVRDISIKFSRIYKEFLYIERSLNIPEYSSFAHDTDDEILALVVASLNGAIDLYEDCGWKVGDERVISVPAISAVKQWSDTDNDYISVGETHSAQSVTIVLTHRGEREGLRYSESAKNKDGSERRYPAFEWDFKDCYTEKGFMNTSNVTTGSWEKSFRKYFFNYLDMTEFSDISADGHFNGTDETKLFLPVYLIQRVMGIRTAKEYNSSDCITSWSRCGLRAEQEIFGTCTVANPIEADEIEQVEYYKTAANRIKKANGKVANWWLRSPYATDYHGFCAVTTSGDVGGDPSTGNQGIAPFGCIG